MRISPKPNRPAILKTSLPTALSYGLTDTNENLTPCFSHFHSPRFLIQNRLIRHGRWIFISLLVIVVVAFVFTIGNTPGCTTNRSNYVSENFYGYDLNSPIDRQALGQKTNLSLMLSTGRPAQNDRQFAELLPQRVALLHLTNQIGVPAPSVDELGAYLRSRPIFFGPEGQFSAEVFTRFSDNIESNPEMPKDIISTVLEEDYRIEQDLTSM